jgi:ribosomal protein S18 acetylase RimI-like enzyme
MSFSVSPAREDDYPAFAALFPELGVPDPVPTREVYAATIAPQAIVVRAGDAVLGYALARPRGALFHVVHVITAPGARGRGVGHALVDALRARGHAAGFTRWMLNVKPDNASAIRLYERAGMRAVFTSLALRLDVAGIDALPDEPVEVRVLSREDDADFELSPGELATFRALPGRIVLAAGDGLGLAVLDPAWPGLMPFRCVRPTVARALLEAARGHASSTRFMIFVEGDPGLAAVLVAAGAEEVLRAIRMEGEL